MCCALGLEGGHLGLLAGFKHTPQVTSLNRDWGGETIDKQLTQLTK